jgi:hypothetical protein
MFKQGETFWRVVWVLSIVALVTIPEQTYSQPIDLQCRALSPTGTNVTIDVPAGKSIVARCRHNSSDPALRFPVTSALRVQFRCGVGSTLVLDGWRQSNGSLEVVPPAGSAKLDSVRVEASGSALVESTTGHALSFVAPSVVNCSLSVGGGTTLRGTESAASFISTSVINSSIAVGADCEVSAAGYAAAAVVASGSGDFQLILKNVTLSSQRGTTIRALGTWSATAATRSYGSYVAALGAAGGSLNVVNCTFTAHDCAVHGKGRNAVASVGVASFSDVGSSVFARGVTLRASSSSVTASGDSSVASLGFASAGLGSQRGAVTAVDVVDATITAVSSSVSAAGESAVSSAAIVSFGRSTYQPADACSSCSVSNTVRAPRASISVTLSNITSYATRWGLASVGVASYSSTGRSVSTSLAADGVSLTATSSNVAAMGYIAVASLAIVLFGGSGSVSTCDLLAMGVTLSASSSNVTAYGSSRSGNPYAISSVGIASRCSSGAGATSTINATSAAMDAIMSIVTSNGLAAASVGIASYVDSSDGLSSVTVDATSANLSAVLCDVTTSGIAAASVGFAGYAVTHRSGRCSSVFNGGGATVGAVLSNVTVTGPYAAVSGVGVASWILSQGLGSSGVNLTRARLSAASSNVTVIGTLAAASVAVSDYVRSDGGSATSSIEAIDANLSATSSSVVAVGDECVAAVAVASKTTSTSSSQQTTVTLHGFSVFACRSSVSSVGRHIVAAVGVATTGRLIVSNSHWLVCGSRLSLGALASHFATNCTDKAPCGAFSVLSLLAASVASSDAIASNRLLLGDSQLLAVEVRQLSLSFCANIGNALPSSGY